MIEGASGKGGKLGGLPGFGGTPLGLDIGGVNGEGADSGFGGGKLDLVVLLTGKDGKAGFPLEGIGRAGIAGASASLLGFGIAGIVGLFPFDFGRFGKAGRALLLRLAALSAIPRISFTRF